MFSPFLLAVASLGAVVAFGGAYEYGHHTGVVTGRNEVQVRWDAEINKRVVEDQAKRDQDRNKGIALATKFENQHRELEVKYARTSKALVAALRTKTECPTSGEVGDIILPADVVRGMFNRDAPAAQPVPTRPTTAEPDNPLRGGTVTAGWCGDSWCGERNRQR